MTQNRIRPQTNLNGTSLRKIFMILLKPQEKKKYNFTMKMSRIPKHDNKKLPIISVILIFYIIIATSTFLSRLQWMTAVVHDGLRRSPSASLPPPPQSPAAQDRAGPPDQPVGAAPPPSSDISIEKRLPQSHKNRNCIMQINVIKTITWNICLVKTTSSV